MKKPRLVAFASLIVIGFIVMGCTRPPMTPGWVTLVGAGKALENFDRYGDADWRMEDGALVADKGTGNSYIVSKNSYSDFELRAEFWADHTTNSGIHIRVQQPGNVTDTNSYEVNIFDARPDPTYATGAIVNFAPALGSPRAGGRWNTYEVTARGAEIAVTLNGVRTAELKHGAFARGPIALQYNANPGGAIKWRRVIIRPL